LDLEENISSNLLGDGLLNTDLKGFLNYGGGDNESFGLFEMKILDEDLSHRLNE
jgi:hypothetical protein